MERIANHLRKSAARGRRGMVLIIVLVVIMALSLAAYTFSDLMLAHHQATKLNGTRIQTRYLVDSGVDFVKYYLSLDPATQVEMGGHYDNPMYFQGTVVIPEVDLGTRYMDIRGVNARGNYVTLDAAIATRGK